MIGVVAVAAATSAVVSLAVATARAGGALRRRPPRGPAHTVADPEGYVTSCTCDIGRHHYLDGRPRA